MNKYTRKQRLNNECSHAEYYAQFVNQWQLDQVSSKIGLDAILNSTDEHLNDIPLKKWDNIGVCSVSVDKMRSLGDSYSLAGAVCINKEAARQLKEANHV